MPCATVSAASLSTACFPTSSGRTAPPPTSVKTSDDRILPPPSEEAVDMVFREVLKLFNPMPGATLGDMREEPSPEGLQRSHNATLTATLHTLPLLVLSHLLHKHERGKYQLECATYSPVLDAALRTWATRREGWLSTVADWAPQQNGATGAVSQADDFAVLVGALFGGQPREFQRAHQYSASRA
ncbi:hypothetical protein BD310DRAFT_1036194 [Dichomitus squalens]|uniref:Uncharacterized protein n=1 Tax=Dichomitus squalens TaxID=114155 RepID=A0A4Q9Q6U4_9APHY|nr:hypothetical protein BD310DRAFT_1036194 [Dichomitus squalens]